MDRWVPDRTKATGIRPGVGVEKISVVTQTPVNDLTGAVDLICYDFDGVMTDNRVWVSEDGREAVAVNRADGMAVAALRQAGLRQIILSTETNPVVAARARKLKIEIIQGLADKAATLTAFTREHDIDLARVAFIGNDLNDLSVMSLVGYPIAPADAHRRVLALACHVTAAKGGDGVVREFCETLFPGVL